MPDSNGRREDELEVVEEAVDDLVEVAPQPNVQAPAPPRVQPTQQPAPQPYTLEPELYCPVPRPLVPTDSTNRSRRKWIGLLIVIPSLALVGAWLNHRETTSLRARGVEVEATLSDVDRGILVRKRSKPKGTYLFRVAGKEYRHTVEFSDQEFEAARVGDRRTLVYLPDDPNVADTKDSLTQSNFTATTKIFFACAGITGAALLVIWLVIERYRSVMFYQLSHGRAVPTETLKLKKTTESDDKSNWRVEYTYLHDGQEMSGTDFLKLKQAQRIFGPGARATVLYDPNRPKSSSLYMSLTEWATVEPAG